MLSCSYDVKKAQSVRRVSAYFKGTDSSIKIDHSAASQEYDGVSGSIKGKKQSEISRIKSS